MDNDFINRILSDLRDFLRINGFEIHSSNFRITTISWTFYRYYRCWMNVRNNGILLRFDGGLFPELKNFNGIQYWIDLANPNYRRKIKSIFEDFNGVHGKEIKRIEKELKESCIPTPPFMKES